jgi:putative transposase
MPRIARSVIPDVPHHVTQRGNRRQDVLFDGEAMLKRLRLRTRTGRPAGDAALVERLEDLSGRFLAPRNGGRPRKADGRQKAGKHK